MQEGKKYQNIENSNSDITNGVIELKLSFYLPICGSMQYRIYIKLLVSKPIPYDISGTAAK